MIIYQPATFLGFDSSGWAVIVSAISIIVLSIYTGFVIATWRTIRSQVDEQQKQRMDALRPVLTFWADGFNGPKEEAVVTVTNIDPGPAIDVWVGRDGFTPNGFSWTAITPGGIQKGLPIWTVSPRDLDVDPKPTIAVITTYRDIYGRNCSTVAPLRMGPGKALELGETRISVSGVRA